MFPENKLSNKRLCLEAIIAIACFIFVIPAVGRSVSASGAAYLRDVPLGRDSTYQTDITGINKDSVFASCFEFKLQPDHKSDFFKPLPNANWVTISSETLCAGPISETKPLELETHFPADSNLYNQRFGADIKVGRVSHGNLAMNIILSVFIETECKRVLSYEVEGLQIAPICADLTTEWDSILVVNNTGKTDTVEIYWTSSLSKKSAEPEIRLFRKFLIWHLPARKITLEAGEKERIYFKKPFDYFGPEGYIVFIGRSESSYCDLGSGSAKQSN